jgi:hypothetical protein
MTSARLTNSTAETASASRTSIRLAPPASTQSCRHARLSMENGTKIRAVWDVFCPARAVGFRPEFRMCLASHGPKEFGRFHSVARSGQESIAQGLPWVIPRHPISPEGVTRYGEHRLRTFELMACAVLAPSGPGAKHM